MMRVCTSLTIEKQLIKAKGSIFTDALCLSLIYTFIPHQRSLGHKGLVDEDYGMVHRVTSSFTVYTVFSSVDLNHILFSHVNDPGTFVEVDLLHSGLLKQAVDGHVVKSVGVIMCKVNFRSCESEKWTTISAKKCRT